MPPPERSCYCSDKSSLFELTFNVNPEVGSRQWTSRCASHVEGGSKRGARRRLQDTAAQLRWVFSLLSPSTRNKPYRRQMTLHTFHNLTPVPVGFSGFMFRIVRAVSLRVQDRERRHPDRSVRGRREGGDSPRLVMEPRGSAFRG